jgi:hypothetical protein
MTFPNHDLGLLTPPEPRSDDCDSDAARAVNASTLLLATCGACDVWAYNIGGSVMRRNTMTAVDQWL